MFVIQNKNNKFVVSFTDNGYLPIMTSDIDIAETYSNKSNAKEFINYMEKRVNNKKLFNEMNFKVSEIKHREGFTITCNVCGSTNCRICEEIDYDYDENPYTNGYYLRCDDCGEDNREE